MTRTGGNGTDGESREGTSAGRLAREVSTLQAQLLGKLRREMPDGDVDAFAGAAQRLAEAFGAVTAAAVDPVAAPAAHHSAPAPSVPQPAEPPASVPFKPALAAAPPEFPSPETHPSLYRQGHMRRRLDQLLETHRRYGHPFCLAVFDVDGPAARNGHGGRGGGAHRGRRTRFATASGWSTRPTASRRTPSACWRRTRTRSAGCR